MSLPRPLQSGEFYCHKCDKFIPMADHEKHQQEHVKKGK